jgi:ubiquinone/menaquinone biosynthesis C-methylase UbiE
VIADPYAGAAARWAQGATRVYAPIVAELVDMSPCPLVDRLVLDVGAGTGVATAPLRAHGARVVAADASLDMLTWDAARRPPSVVADVRALPLPEAAVDAVVAAFVLNHLADPDRGLAELIRVTRAGGALLAAVYASEFTSALRARVDEVASAAGWRPPEWYVRMKADAVPLLGSAAAMSAAAARAGLADPVVVERPVDVGVERPEELVEYRLGQAPFASWLAQIGPDAGAQVARDATDAVAPDMAPYRPVVVFLAARTPEVPSLA